jgi:hypothetical protein
LRQQRDRGAAGNSFGNFRVDAVQARGLASAHCTFGRLSDTPQEDVRIAIQRSHTLLSDTAQLFDALDACSNFDPITQSVRDLDNWTTASESIQPFDKSRPGLFNSGNNDASKGARGEIAS